MIAGRDTTAVTLSWACFYLSINPDVQKELARELDERLQGRKPSIEELHHSNMPVLNGVLMEALRLAPPVPADDKWSTKEITFPNGVTVPANVLLWYVPYGQNRNPDVYSDPEKFDPSRWYGKMDQIEKDPDFGFKFPVFQAGPRKCLGKALAEIEAKFILACVYQKFTFTLEASENPEEFRPALMATGAIANKADHSEHSLWVIPRHRN